MIHYKNQEEIEAMKRGGHILAEVLSETVKHVKPGVSEIEIDKFAEESIVKKGGYPAFKKVKGYRNATCISTNDVVVHGIPNDYRFKEGDIVGVDCGVFYEGLYTDMAQSVIVGKPKDKETEKFLRTGKYALDEAIKMAIAGNRIGHISKKIQEIVEDGGYSVVRSLIGHGVGKKLHEEPEVPGYLDRALNKTPLLKPGMTFAVEVIYNMGGLEVSYKSDDGWTISTSDKSLSGLFERTIAITNNGTVILTK